MRILHFSDIHLGVPFGEVPFGDWPGKRLIGAAHLLMGRRRVFSAARHKLVELDRFREDHGVDAVIFSGDYTALGTAPELADARHAMRPFLRAAGGFVNVPGNHDVYLPDGVHEKRFEKHFGDTLHSDLEEYRSEPHWPLVRLWGDGVAVVAVNSARPNPNPWKASGRIPHAQLEQLPRIFADPRLRERFVFVVTHYAPRLADGSPDRYTHGLRNADDLLAACAGLERGALLFGHVHECFRVAVPETRIPLFCAGSATQDHVEGAWLFDATPDSCDASPVTWDGARYVLPAAANGIFSRS